MDDMKYKRVADFMVLEGDSDVLAQVLRELAEEGSTVRQDGPCVTVGEHTFVPWG